MKFWLLIASSILVPLAACKDTNLISSLKEPSVPDLPNIHTKLAFTCVHEDAVIPARDAEADQLYRHARWLRKNNLLKEDPAIYPQIERLIRIATAYSHDKANLELRNMLAEGQAESESVTKEILDLTQELIRRGIPGGYYDMARYLEQGYGVKQDSDLALKYYRKAADLGSPTAQYWVAEKLIPSDAAPEIAMQMWRCAAEQGHGEASVALGINLKRRQRYPDAVDAFQQGVTAGNSTAALALSEAFNGHTEDKKLYYLGQQKDPERVRRYKAIGKVLSDYSYLHPKVPDIDNIVPLPPAKLPPWDGTLVWLKEHEANVPPSLPSEARIIEMAKAKGLDPATGRPLPKK